MPEQNFNDIVVAIRYFGDTLHELQKQIGKLEEKVNQLNDAIIERKLANGDVKNKYYLLEQAQLNIKDEVNKIEERLEDIEKKIEEQNKFRWTIVGAVTTFQFLITLLSIFYGR